MQCCGWRASNPQHLRRSSLVRTASFCLQICCLQQWISVRETRCSTKPRCFAPVLLLCMTETLPGLDLCTDHSNTEGWFRPLHHCLSVRNTNDFWVSKWPVFRAFQPAICPETLNPALKSTHPRFALALTPLSVSNPFNAKLAQLSVGYSHSIRPQEGSILTRFNPGAPPQLLSVSGHVFLPLCFSFTRVRALISEPAWWLCVPAVSLSPCLFCPQQRRARLSVSTDAS